MTQSNPKPVEGARDCPRCGSDTRITVVECKPCGYCFSSTIGEAAPLEREVTLREALYQFVGYISVEYKWPQERWENCGKLADEFLKRAALAASQSAAKGDGDVSSAQTKKAAERPATPHKEEFK